MKDINVAMTSAMRANLRSRVNMFDNDWKDQLLLEINQQFHEKTAPKVSKMADTTMNIFRRIVREICTVYREPAKRVLRGAGDDVQARLDALYQKLKIDQVMQVAHRYAKAATGCALLVRPVDEGDFVIRILTPDQIYVETSAESSQRIELFAYACDITDAKGKPKTIWTVYTKDETWFVDQSGKLLDIDPRTGQAYETENKLGIIPVAYFPAEFQARSFWNPNWNADAAEANLKIGLFNTYLSYLVKTQSFKQITITANDVSDEMKDQILDPLFPLLLTPGATAQTLDLNTRLEAIDQVIRGRVSAIANNYGISNENFTLTSSAASGFSLKIANQALQDIREADIPLCSDVEQQLFRVLATLSGEFSADGEIQFNPGEVSWPEEWTTEQARWEFEFKNGISSPVDYLIEQDPQISREEAIAKIKQRQSEIKLLKPSMTGWEVLLNAAGGVGVGLGQAAGGGGAQGAPAGVAATSGFGALAEKAAPEQPPENGKPVQEGAA